MFFRCDNGIMITGEKGQGNKKSQEDDMSSKISFRIIQDGKKKIQDGEGMEGRDGIKLTIS